ncbi:MAG: right-handed parallel beta-helix repeat-containing protein, partial [Kiritimatiellae bacterium]|nr:right-handed parallel beta-helix repeat-containing protein [Kiritimatiellia bacterium]
MKHRSLLVWVVSFAIWGAWAACAGIWWKDHDGNTGSYANNTWDNLQAAINSAQNGLPTGQMGEVRICGDVTRTAGDATTHLSVSGSGNIKISGGWNHNWTVQTNSVRSVLNANGATLTHSNRVMYVATTNVWLDNLWIKQGRRCRTGCGLLATNAHNLVVSDCIVSDNRADVGLFPGSARADGVGINISNSNGVRLRHMVIADNYSGGGYALMSRGTAAFIQNSGTASDPVILEYCHIAENVGGSYSTMNGSGLVIIGPSRVTVANCRFNNNATSVNGQGIYVDGTLAKVVVFSSLFDS